MFVMPIGRLKSLYNIEVMPATPVTGTPALTAKQYTPVDDKKQPIVIIKNLFSLFFIF